MLRIGDLSRLSQVSVRMLRHYDEIGLLKPARVDPDTEYRYYRAGQLETVNRILVLRDLGFSLEEIRQLLSQPLSAETLRRRFEERRAAIECAIQEERSRLEKVESRLRWIEREGSMPEYEIVLKETDSQLVAGVRGIVAAYNQIGILFEKLGKATWQVRGAGPWGALYHDEGYRERDVDCEALVFLKERLPERGDLRVYELPGGTMASTVHRGSYQRLHQAHEALMEWVDANGYTIQGPPREVYLYCTYPVRQDEESYVTELLYPVSKRD